MTSDLERTPKIRGVTKAQGNYSEARVCFHRALPVCTPGPSCTVGASREFKECSSLNEKRREFWRGWCVVMACDLV